MGRKKQKIIVIGKVREFDDATWKRLLLAYAYHLHEQDMAAAEADMQPRAEDQVHGGDS